MRIHVVLSDGTQWSSDETTLEEIREQGRKEGMKDWEIDRAIAEVRDMVKKVKELTYLTFEFQGTPRYFNPDHIMVAWIEE